MANLAHYQGSSGQCSHKHVFGLSLIIQDQQARQHSLCSAYKGMDLHLKIVYYLPQAISTSMIHFKCRGRNTWLASTASWYPSSLDYLYMYIYCKYICMYTYKPQCRCISSLLILVWSIHLPGLTPAASWGQQCVLACRSQAVQPCLYTRSNWSRKNRLQRICH